MTRVIAGSARGRNLAVPPGEGTRPTSDRAREGLFSSWEAQRGSLAGARVLDLFAGSGAVGLEALSRGAGHALLVESDPAAVKAILVNVRTLGLPGAEVRPAQVEKVLAGEGPQLQYDTLFLDPPYAVTDDAVREILITLGSRGWLADGTIATVERGTRGGEFTWPAGFRPLRARRYGEATLWHGRVTADGTDSAV